MEIVTITTRLGKQLEMHRKQIMMSVAMSCLYVRSLWLLLCEWHALCAREFGMQLFDH